jgi:hypothetical protein
MMLINILTITHPNGSEVTDVELKAFRAEIAALKLSELPETPFVTKYVVQKQIVEA